MTVFLGTTNPLHKYLELATSSSIVGRIAFGPNAGKKVTMIGAGFAYYEEIPMAKGHRCFSINGFSIYRFSLHANTATNTLSRDRLRKLVEYISRGSLSNERLEITKSGLVKLKLKTAYSDGTSHLIFTHEEFIITVYRKTVHRKTVYRNTECIHCPSKIPSRRMERAICAKLTLPQKIHSKARGEKS